MQQYESLEGLYVNNIWLTIGTFDGVHRGHQQIIQALVSGAKVHQAKTAVLTFFPHPAIILGKRNSSSYLTSPKQRVELLGEMGIDIVVTYPFSKHTANLSPDEFLSQVREHLAFSHLVVGHDFALGKNRSGNVVTLQALGMQHGFTVDIIPPFWLENKLVSSSEVRQAIIEGDLRMAAELLGRPYSIIGKVIHGDGRGKKIGIPTANLDVWSEQVIPKNGIYACWVDLEGKRWQAVANIGYRPTFESTNPSLTIEVHILDFSGDLYGKNLRVDFTRRIRDEIQFSGVDALLVQIEQDIQQTREILSSRG